MFGYIDTGMFKAIKDKELLACRGPANYILCHPVVRPLSDSTKVRIISNSSLPNSKSGWSYNEYAAQEPQLPGPINGSSGDMEGLTKDSFMGLG